MTKFELRYGTRTAIVENKAEITMKEFLDFLATIEWIDLEDEPVAVRVDVINSVKKVE